MKKKVKGIKMLTQLILILPWYEVDVKGKWESNLEEEEKGVIPKVSSLSTNRAVNIFMLWKIMI
jgi:hypothetical protein